MVKAKQTQWSNEAKVSAARAILQGRTGTLVQYQTGMKMVRFAEPFKDFGMHYEVTPEVWSELTGNIKSIAK